MLTKNNLDKRITNLEKINFSFDENKMMTEKIAKLIKESEKELGREPLLPLDPSREYAFEELCEYYRRDY